MRTKSSGVVGADHNTQDAYIKQLEEKLAFFEASKKEDIIEDPVAIQGSDYIRVMNLLNYRLNLCTKENGQGKVFKFDKFGQVKKILYSDLVDILEVHANFLEAGYFYILNPTLIRLHGLNEIYAKILTKEKIEQILSAQSDECLALYSSANEGQQEIIIQHLIDKVRDNPDSVNLNVIDRISRLSKIDISKIAEEGKRFETLAETNK